MIKNCTALSRWIVTIAFTAVISLAIGHGVDLGDQTLGGGPASTAAVIGDVAGLIACGVSAVLGVRMLRRTRAC